MRPEDQSARERALLSDRNLAVTAGAGTGKTTLLVDKVLAQILVRGMDVRRILMMTFTEKAANEMRIRLERELRNLDAAPWEARGARDVAARVERALAGLDRTEIGTIHSFCAHILREYPVEAGLDPDFQVDEGGRFADLFARLWPRWLDEELALDAPHAAGWKRILRKVDLTALEDVARTLASFRIPLESLGRASGLRFYEETASSVAGELERIAALGPEKNNLTGQLREVAVFLRTGEGTYRDRPSEAAKGWGDRFGEAHALVRQGLALARARRDEDGALLDDMILFLGGFVRRFRDLYTKEGCVSFDGLLLLVRDLLLSGRFPGIRAELQARYDFILVDEFQDTDPLQCEIVLFLGEEGARAKSASEVRLRPGKLFIVGDPKQSIYSFRGADIVAYDELKDRILAQGGEPVVLRSNFRSRESLLEAVNGIFSKLIRENGRLQPPYEPLLATRAGGPAIELVLFEHPERKAKSEEVRACEAVAMAEWIRSSGIAWGDAAILLKALTDVHLIVDALRAEGIPYVVEGEKYFYQVQEVIDFVNLLAAIASPEDRLAMAGILRSPLGALDDRTLYEIRDRLDYRKPAPLPELVDLWELLSGMHSISVEGGAGRVVEELFEKTFLLENAAAGLHGEQAAANLLKLRDAAHAYDAETGGALTGFLRRLRAAVRDLEEEGESPLEDEGRNAVKILSIHKAKGLEFPVVLLPDLHRRTRPRREGPCVRFDWPTQSLGLALPEIGDPAGAALAWLEERRRREEDRRVLYVAMTRARERMLLFGSADFERESYLGMMAEAGAFDVLDVRRRRMEEVKPKRRKGGEIPAREEDWNAFLAEWRARESMEERPRLTSVSAMEREDVSPQPPRDPATRAVVNRSGSSRGVEIGILCHEVLERLDFRRPVIPEVDPEAREILESFLRSPAFEELAGAEILAREVPFLLPQGEQIVQGFIDVVYRKDGRVYVGDYKTDREIRPEEYERAGDIYCAAVRAALGVEPAGFRLFYLRHGVAV